jgi:hypothetical protein
MRLGDTASIAKDLDRGPFIQRIGPWSNRPDGLKSPTSRFEPGSSIIAPSACLESGLYLRGASRARSS